MKKLSLILAVVALFAPGMFAASTPVSDTVYAATNDEPAATGSYIVVRWPRFTTTDLKVIPAGQRTIQLGAGGTLTLSLQPTDTATPAFNYTVEYHLTATDGTQESPYAEYWAVPTSGVAKKITDLAQAGPPPVIGAVKLTTKGDLVGTDGTNVVRIPSGTNDYMAVRDDAAASGIAWKPRASQTAQTVTFSATPTFNANLGGIMSITLTGNVTSMTFSNLVAGQRFQMHLCQDATGSRTVVWPASFHGVTTIGSTASKCNDQAFWWDGAAAWAIAPGVINQ